MAVLSWGKPKVEFGKCKTGGDQTATWTTMPEIKENTTELSTEQGDVTEAKEEGGAIVDVKRAKSKFTLTLTIYMKKGATLPITDDDGVIIDDYSVRLTPEDEACTGFVLDCCTVSIVKTYSSADGYLAQYTFEAKKPKTGQMFKEYVKTTATAGS